jgi:hypothetical protein
VNFDLETFTLTHVVISLIAIAAGFVAARRVYAVEVD